MVKFALNGLIFFTFAAGFLFGTRTAYLAYKQSVHEEMAARTANDLYNPEIAITYIGDTMFLQGYAADEDEKLRMGFVAQAHANTAYFFDYGVHPEVVNLVEVKARPVARKTASR